MTGRCYQPNHKMIFLIIKELGYLDNYWLRGRCYAIPISTPFTLGHNDLYFPWRARGARWTAKYRQTCCLTAQNLSNTSSAIGALSMDLWTS